MLFTVELLDGVTKHETSRKYINYFVSMYLFLSTLPKYYINDLTIH